MVRVSSLFIYPVKGMRAVPVDRAEVLPGGLRHDRRFVVVRAADGVAVTQRQHPKLALGRAGITDGTLSIALDAGVVHVDLAPLSTGAPGAPRRRVRIFDDATEGAFAGAEAASLLSTFLGEPVELVFMPADVVRPVEEPHAEPGDRVGFADGYPLLIAAEASLAALNRDIVAAGGAPVPMARFRPNVVLTGSEPWMEEEAARIRIGSVELRTPKKCARCVVTTVDQDTAVKGKEPLVTLARTRTRPGDHGANFAMNAIPVLGAEDSPPFIAVGDPVVFL
jgi:uncharacterized protein YcbX